MKSCRQWLVGTSGLLLVAGCGSSASSTGTVVRSTSSTIAATAPAPTTPAASVSTAAPVPAATEPAQSSPAGPPIGDAAEILTTGGATTTWFIVSRSENGQPPQLPQCADGDLLIFKAGGTFDSVIGTTQCNPAEVPVIDGTYELSADKTVITFTAQGFTYTGKLLEVMPNRLVIEFDLGIGSPIIDEFILRP
jgi:hypothetical protein